MRLSTLTYFVLEVNAALDTGLFDDISIGEVQQHIESKDVIPWLSKALGEEIDLSLFDDESTNTLHEQLLDILGGYKGQEGRKWGVEHRGLCLLVAWGVECIQRKDWD